MIDRRAGALPAVRPTRIEVDLDALISNARSIRGFAKTKLFAVVKADAYGHGAEAVARALSVADAADGFAVSLVEEGVRLRAAGVDKPILVLGPAQHGGYDEMLARRLVPMISDPSDWYEASAIASRRGAPLTVHLKLETGMGRLGLAPERAIELAESAKSAGIVVGGAMTHFACADIDDPNDRDCLTYTQLARFEPVAARLRAAAGSAEFVCHAANSSGTMLFPSARYDLVRCGIALYGNGSWQPDAVLPTPRRQAMRLITNVAQIRSVDVGASVGYGALWTATRPSRVAILSLGYADGVPRRMTGHGHVLIHGQRCPLVGAVSMDIVTVDVTDLGDRVHPGDDAVLLGAALSDGDASISTADFASWAGVTEYEVTCGMSKRVPRVYVGGEDPR